MKILGAAVANLSGSESTQAFWQRSAVRAWIYAVISVVVLAWSDGQPIVEALRENAKVLLVSFGAIITDASITRSGRVQKEAPPDA